MALYTVDKETGDITLSAGGTNFADNPVGSIIPFGGTSEVVPSGWFLCDGRAISRTEYSVLFDIIGTNFGEGDGSTTFNLPDMRESVPKGAGLTGNSSNHIDADGLALGEFLDDQIQDHIHGAPNSANFFITGNVASMVAGSGVSYGGSNVTTKQTSGRHGATTEVKSVGVNYIIKAKIVSIPTDFMSAVDEAIDTSNVAKMLPYSFNKSSNISAFNRKFVHEGNSLSWTATHTGRLTLRLLKNGDGYSLYLYKNTNILIDSYDNFFGTDSQSSGCTQASITLQGWVKKGDSIRLESNLPSSTAYDHMFFCQTGLLAYNDNYD